MITTLQKILHLTQGSLLILPQRNQSLVRSVHNSQQDVYDAEIDIILLTRLVISRSYTVIITQMDNIIGISLVNELVTESGHNIKKKHFLNPVTLLLKPIGTFTNQVIQPLLGSLGSSSNLDDYSTFQLCVHYTLDFLA